MPDDRIGLSQVKVPDDRIETIHVLPNVDEKEDTSFSEDKEAFGNIEAGKQPVVEDEYVPNVYVCMHTQ
jgi:hypothetical protein